MGIMGSVFVLFSAALLNVECMGQPTHSQAVLSTIPAFDFKATLMTLVTCCDYLGRAIHDTSLLVDCVLALFSPSPVGGHLVLIRELWLLTRHGYYVEDVHGPAVPFLQ